MKRDIVHVRTILRIPLGNYGSCVKIIIYCHITLLDLLFFFYFVYLNVYTENIPTTCARTQVDTYQDQTTSTES